MPWPALAECVWQASPAMKTLGDLVAHANAKLFGGDHIGALHAYAAAVRVQPNYLDARLRVADSLLSLGEVQRAAVVYTSLARHCSHAGYPLRALVALKILSALEPQLAEKLPELRQVAQGIIALIGRHPHDERLPSSNALPQELQCALPLSQLG